MNLSQTNRIGVLITNLGTPEAPTKKALRRYLAEFLSDPRVIELPRWLWRPILHGVILRFRPRYSAKLYQKVWTAQGSPLLTISQQQAQGLQTVLTTRGKSEIEVALGMRYGAPSIAQAMEHLRQKKINKLIVFPLYPQYSSATTGSTFDAVAKVLKTWRWIPQVHMINHYANDPGYINALVESIHTHWNNSSKGEQLLFSFHGIPMRQVKAGDPYYDMCQQTARLAAEKLHLSPEDWQIVFQSRLGRAKWLQPYCDKVLKSLPKQGVKKVDVICPGFAADCLETLEEIAQRHHEIFIAAGGMQLNYIPALNATHMHLNALADILMPHIEETKSTIPSEKVFS